LDVEIDDVDAFLLDPRHRAKLSGTVWSEKLGLQPVSGTVDLLVAGKRPGHRQMVYSLAFTCAGTTWRLSGVKDVEDDPGFDLWRDTTTLYTQLFRKDAPGVQGAGILRVSLRGFLRLVISLVRGAGHKPPHLRALARFLHFFLGTLVEVYVNGPGPRPRFRGVTMREIPVYTLDGVKDAKVGVYPFSTKDGLGLTLTRFSRGDPRGDAVLLLHGLTSSSDMFIMPEHRNLVTFLLDSDFTDVWCLDSRISNRFVYNLPPWRFSLDDVALFDYPAALDVMKPHLAGRRVAVISHCVGSLTFLMALFGKVVDEKSLSCVVANSVGLTPRISRWQRVKLSMAPRLLELLGLPFISPRWHEYPAPSVPRLVAWAVSLVHRECRVRACHMLSLMWGDGRPAAYRHETLHPATHDRVADLFGAVGFSYYRHILRMVRAGKAVKYDPGNPAYKPLPDDYLLHAREVRTPVLFATGSHNRVFRGSNEACYALMQHLVPGRHRFKMFDGYGHQDVIIGKDAEHDVFPSLLHFLNHSTCTPCAKAS
jgi:cholesterol oxidase